MRNSLRKDSLSSLPVYTLLFGIYPVLFLWSANRAQQPAYVVIPSLVFTFLYCLITYLIGALILRSASRAALPVTIINFTVFSYGHIDGALRAAGLTIQQRYLMPALLLPVLFLCLVLILRRVVPSPAWTKNLNFVSAALVLLAVLPTGYYYLTRDQAARTASVETISAGLPSARLQNLPDVYLIIIDNYGRQDFLQETAGYDNAELIQALEQRGFVLPNCAQGNYIATAQVIASILNMDYLDHLGVPQQDYMDESRHGVLWPYIQNNGVMEKFKSYGYKTVTFRGYMDLIDLKNVDHYVNFESDMNYNDRLETQSFQDLYLRTSIFHPINGMFHIYPELVSRYSPPVIQQMLPESALLESRFYKIYQQNIYAIEALKKMPEQVGSPKFVYAHLYAAHWPYMVQPDGSLRLPFTEAETIEGYIAGVQYINNNIVDAIDQILVQSDTPPVIIIQGDHSYYWEGPIQWSGKNRVKIFSAYYLPNGGDQLLYDEITPVNNFRLVFKHYFGEPIDLLPDHSIYTDPNTGEVYDAPKTCISDSLQK